MKRVMLIVRDGWGFTDQSRGNAIKAANTPFDDTLNDTTQQVLLRCYGEFVGLPEGFQGSSEVGHMNMGAGRIVVQEVTRIFDAIADGSFFETKAFKNALSYLEKPETALHLFGLLQDEGVHAHQEHLYQLIQNVKQRLPKLMIWVHPIADGRDTPPRSFLKFYHKLQEVMAGYDNISTASVWGRYYGMDRSENWNLIKIAYDAMVFGKGNRTDDIDKTVKKSYQQDKTPDGYPMFDEYLTPIINSQYKGMKPDDVVINFNYRQDRAIQISKAFIETSCPAFDPFSQKVHYYGLTRYYDEFENFIIPAIDEGSGMKHLLGEVLSLSGKKQLRIAETQKFRHVTSFFNGKKTNPFPGEDRIHVKSQFDPSSFASHPEMNANDVTQELLVALDKDYDFIVVNYANCDMVGHTGEFEAAKKAAEYVDRNVQKVTQKAHDKKYNVLITADHGNSEEMLDEHGEPKTSHTINPVKLHLIAPGKKPAFGQAEGILSDIAPLVLKLMDIDVPEEMTSDKLAKTLK